MRACFLYIMLSILMSSSLFGQTKAPGKISSDFLALTADEKIELDNSLQSFTFFGDDFNILSFNKKNISVGINTLFEEDLPESDLKFSNFFVYDIGVNFFLKRFRMSLFFENFFNLSSKELSIAPAYVENMNTLVYLEHDTPSMVHLSLVYSF